MFEKERSCLIRYLYLLDEYTNVEKGEINDLEIAREELNKELKELFLDD